MRHFYIFLLCIFSSVTICRGQQWTPMKAFPAGGASGLLSFVINDTAYIGGDGSNLYRYDPGKNTWTSFVKLPTGNLRFSGISFSINGKGYIGMGVPGTGGLYNDLWELDPSTKKWTRKADFPYPGRDGMIAFVAGGKAYIGAGTDNTLVYSDFFEFDPVANTWTEKEPIPSGPLVFASTFNIKGYGYIIGGSHNGSTDFNVTTLKYDHVHNTWMQFTDFTGTPRQSGVAFSLAGKAYYGLGGTSFSDTFNDILEYDPAADEWNNYTEMPADPRGFPVAVSLSGKVYIGTGSNYSTSTLFYSDWWRLDPSVNASVSKNQGTGRFSIYPNPAHSSFFVSGGDSHFSSHVRLYDLLGNEYRNLKQTAAGKYDCSDLPRGEYFLNVKGLNEDQTLRLIKE